jgi:acyl-ACP thioesterase
MPAHDAAGTLEMTDPTVAGRIFRARRRVRLGDATVGARLRLDAAVRWLQDAANDDSRDAGFTGSDLHDWVVRRTVLDVSRFPVYLDEVDVATWCSGLGSHWAERRTRISAPDGSVCLDGAALWVHVDTATMSPRRLSAEAARVWGDAAAGRRVRARLVLDPVEADSVAPESTNTWPMRRTDIDALGHMNNAAVWEIVEERLAERRDLRAGSRFIVEHIGAVEPGEHVVWSVHRHGESESIRIRVGDEVRVMCWMGAAPAR